MNKGYKIGIIIIIIIVVSMLTAVSTLLIKEKKPIDNIKNPDFLVDSYDGITFEVETDKDSYNTGEDITITLTLTNTNNEDNAVYCKGWVNSTNGENYTPFNYYAYIDSSSYIWHHTSYPDDVSPPIFLEPPTYNFTIDALSTFTNSYIWNQTALENDTYVQVPSGYYFIVANLDVTWEYYQNIGQAIPLKQFGNYKLILIE